MIIVPIQELGRRLQPGDRVLVREDLGVGRNSYAMLQDPSDRIRAVGSMFDFRGKIVTIRESYKYCLKVREDTWNWTDEMFEGVVIDTPADCDDDVSGWDCASIHDLLD